ncbi:ATP-binding protein [Hufsiella ginkgonis]|uniref:histidine kinase n=1 Tax=Hufsiella ginkgonis TaxID=2695274 RepID=A0A7K1XW03_9SPHI|nr:ATP-binding protein [Hufsiella ginkgonis]MXV15163.1 response regulator [Hufsiella ginkgonis]
MIKTAYKIPVLRYGLVVSLIAFLFIGSFYLYLHYTRAQKLRQDIDRLVFVRENSALIDSCILALYTADNDSRLFSVTADKKYLSQFLDEINHVSHLLSRIKPENQQLFTASSERIRLLMDKKTTKTNDYIRLRHLTDSLIGNSESIGVSLTRKNNKVSYLLLREVKSTVRIDTITADHVPQKKRRLLGRLAEAFSKKPLAGSQPVLVRQEIETSKAETLMIPKPVIQPYRTYYRKIYKANTSLRRNEREILFINSTIIGEIINILRTYKSLEQNYLWESKQQLRGTIMTVFSDFTQLSLLNIGLLVTLVTTLLYNIWKIFNNEKALILYSENARKYATAKSSFLASMSHEIRTPLNSIIGFAEQLDQGRLTANQSEQVTAIRHSSDMLLEVVNQILDFSKYETGKMNLDNSPFKLVEVIEGVSRSMSILAEKKGIALRSELKLEPQLCVTGDAFRLKQVMVNLISNAIKFTAQGEVYLHAWNSLASDDSIVLHVKVKDTGIGISKEDLPNIFNEFSQVNSAQSEAIKGTGLGLAICKKIVELQNGHIHVQSEPGNGSTFSFHIPYERCDEAACEAGRDIASIDLTEQLKGRHILLAEDNKLNVLLAKTILKKWNMTYDVAYNGMEALELCKMNHYDLVLTDIQMPEMTGIELAKEIRQLSDKSKSGIPIVALTANVLKEDHDKYIAAGINDVALKPFLEKNLVEKIALNVDKWFSTTFIGPERE